MVVAEVHSALLRLVPRDAARVLELCPADAPPALLPAFHSLNPAVRFLTVRIGKSLPPAAFLAGLAREQGQADAVVIHPGLGDGDAVLHLASGALACLIPRGILVAALPPSTMPRNELAAQWMARLAEHGMLLDRIASDKDGRPLAFRAVRAAHRPQPMVITTLTLRPAGGVNDKRVNEPNLFLESLPGVVTQTRLGGLAIDPEPRPYAKVVVLQRQILGPACIETHRKLVAAGYLVIAEFDDHPDFWPRIGADGHLTFRAAHAVQTSTQTLAGHLQAYNDEVIPFPNQMAMLSPLPTRSDAPVTLFAGAFNRTAEWRNYRDVLQRVLDEGGGRVAIQVVHDREFFDSLDTEHKRFAPVCRYPDYLALMRRCDIALLPLHDTEFNRCKSDLKFIEGGSQGLACLASPVVYDGSIEDGVTGMLFRDTQEFEAKLRRLIERPDERRAIGERAYFYVRNNRMLSQHFRKRLDWYRALLARKPELDAALLKRLDAAR